MASTDAGIAGAIARVAETMARLIVQHAQLLRSELEGEGKILARRGRRTAIIVGKATPIVIAGVVLLSFAIAQFVGALLEGFLGRFATPLALLVIGAAEAGLATRWLVASLARLEAETKPPRATIDADKTQPPVPESQQPVPANLVHWPPRSDNTHAGKTGEQQGDDTWRNGMSATRQAIPAPGRRA